MKQLYIDPSEVKLELDGGEGFPQLGVTVDGVFITNALRCLDGARFERDPEKEYGIPDDFARAMGIINMWLKTWSEAGDMGGRRFVCAWTGDYVEGAVESLENRATKLETLDAYLIDKLPEENQMELASIFVAEYDWRRVP
jgi:hypothetical protein